MLCDFGPTFSLRIFYSYSWNDTTCSTDDAFTYDIVHATPRLTKVYLYWIIESACTSAKSDQCLACACIYEIIVSYKLPQRFASMTLVWKSKWVWSDNTTITNCRPNHGTGRQSHRAFTVTRHPKDNKSIAFLVLSHWLLSHGIERFVFSNCFNMSSWISKDIWAVAWISNNVAFWHV